MTGRIRLVVLGLVVLCLAPAIISGLTYSPDAPTGNTTEASNVTFVGVQGSFGPGENGRVVAMNTTSKEVLWEYSNESAGENVIYYDVDPLSEDRILVVQESGGIEAWTGMALVIDWRDDEVVDRFTVPSDTHDIDYLGHDRYAIADKFDHRAYIYDSGADEIVWEYNFSNHYPAYPEAGDDPASQPSGGGGYTHLNDVDVVDNGSSVLLSPRNFDRVVLVNRSTKEIEWVLGAQDDHETLHAQHNPTLLSTDPPVVLVADSENDRVVEYRQRDDGTWEQTWAYSGDLVWPRDADRLPNGNTLVVDSRGQRVLEVTPDHDIVWEREIATMPYDIERLQYGDEPAGPPIHTLDNTSVGEGDDTEPGVSPFRDFYTLSLWVLPSWVGLWDFYGLVAALCLGVGWLAGELVVRVRN